MMRGTHFETGSFNLHQQLQREIKSLLKKSFSALF